MGTSFVKFNRPIFKWIDRQRGAPSSGVHFAMVDPGLREPADDARIKDYCDDYVYEQRRQFAKCYREPSVRIW